jgi:hypothetical protein
MQKTKKRSDKSNQGVTKINDSSFAGYPIQKK